MRFWDASALVPLLVGESRSPTMRRLATEEPEMIIWWGSPVECTSALCRLEREGAIDLEARRAASDLLAALAAASAQVLPSEEVRARALRLLAVQPLRAADSLQLAAALTWCRESPAGTAFVCLDNRLCHAAAVEGFDVLP